MGLFSRASFGRLMLCSLLTQAVTWTSVHAAPRLSPRKPLHHNIMCFGNLPDEDGWPPNAPPRDIYADLTHLCGELYVGTSVGCRCPEYRQGYMLCQPETAHPILYYRYRGHCLENCLCETVDVAGLVTSTNGTSTHQDDVFEFGDEVYGGDGVAWDEWTADGESADSRGDSDSPGGNRDTPGRTGMSRCAGGVAGGSCDAPEEVGPPPEHHRPRPSQPVPGTCRDRCTAVTQQCSTSSQCRCTAKPLGGPHGNIFQFFGSCASVQVTSLHGRDTLGHNRTGIWVDPNHGGLFEAETMTPVACPCNATYVSYKCCASEDGVVQEPPEHKLGEIGPEV
ncbi:MAG: hypothetical protein M1817_000118 [Caeruleum heppii]|nr:MAG: hypothetical protein M1817_000118 [Caeruleum heppii]